MMLGPAGHHLHHVSYPIFKWTSPQHPLLPDTLLHHQVAWQVNPPLADIVGGPPEQSNKALTLAKLRGCMLGMSIVVAQKFEK